MLAMIAIARAGEISIGRIVSDIPHDGQSIVVYVMLLAFAGLIWRGSRRRLS